MKNFCLFCFVLFTSIVLAQKGNGFGVKGGLNFSANGDFTTPTLSETPERNIGFHLGVFGKLDAGPIYLRPELVYTRTQSEFTIDNLIVSKFDVPLLVGLDIFDSLSVFAGPSLQYIVNNDFEEITLQAPENDFTIGAQLGVGINFEHFGIDLRYERGLTENEALLTGVPESRVDTRPDQFILSLSVKL